MNQREPIENVIADRTRSRSRESGQSQDRGRPVDARLSKGRSKSRTGDASRSRSRGAKSASTIPDSPDVGVVQEAEEAAAKEAAEREADELEAERESARMIAAQREAQRRTEERRARVMQRARELTAAHLRQSSRQRSLLQIRLRLMREPSRSSNVKQLWLNSTSTSRQCLSGSSKRARPSASASSSCPSANLSARQWCRRASGSLLRISYAQNEPNSPRLVRVARAYRAKYMRTV